MPHIFNVLIVEHEGLLIDILKNAFSHLSAEGKKFNLHIVSRCMDALDVIENHNNIDLALLNIDIPPCKHKKVLFIEDISLKLRFRFPDIKIMAFSNYKNNMHLHSLFESLNPESVLIKSDINYKELLKALENVIKSTPYYSKTVLNYMRQSLTNNIIIDKIDKTILHYLSVGTKMKDLPHFVHLSRSAVESRKRRLREVFGVDQKGDYQLILNAREKGFL